MNLILPILFIVAVAALFVLSTWRLNVSARKGHAKIDVVEKLANEARTLQQTLDACTAFDALVPTVPPMKHFSGRMREIRATLRAKLDILRS